MAQFQQVIKAYLDQRAEQDAQFNVSYNNKEKSIEQCCAYLMSEAKKRCKGSGCVAISDAEVFGLAVYYYDEKEIEFEEVSGYVASSTQEKETPGEKKEKKISPVQRKKPIQETDQRQMSLF